MRQSSIAAGKSTETPALSLADWPVFENDYFDLVGLFADAAMFDIIQRA
jgi:hypothetical protein